MAPAPPPLRWIRLLLWFETNDVRTVEATAGTGTDHWSVFLEVSLLSNWYLYTIR
jgi:hypothetical protein